MKKIYTAVFASDFGEAGASISVRSFTSHESAEAAAQEYCANFAQEFDNELDDDSRDGDSKFLSSTYGDLCQVEIVESELED